MEYGIEKLRDLGMSRDLMAEKLGCSKSAIDAYLAPQGSKRHREVPLRRKQLVNQVVSELLKPVPYTRKKITVTSRDDDKTREFSSLLEAFDTYIAEDWRSLHGFHARDISSHEILDFLQNQQVDDLGLFFFVSIVNVSQSDAIEALKSGMNSPLQEENSYYVSFAFDSNKIRMSIREYPERKDNLYDSL